MIESASSGLLQVDKEDQYSMRTLEGGRMDAPATGVCGRGRGNGRGTASGRGGGSRGGGVAGATGRGTVPTRILPPCRVCGLTATGFHYGANTCEACKAFFRRMVGRPAPPHYSCQGNCQPEPERGLSCPHCRLQRCLSVGMSLKAVKRGRYTHERKAQNILEVKQLSTPPKSTVQQTYDINSNAEKTSYKWADIPTPLMSNSTHVTSEASVSPVPSPSSSSNTSFSDSGRSPGYASSSQGFTPSPPVRNVRERPPAIPVQRDEELDALLQRMVTIHSKFVELKPEDFKDRIVVEARYKEERKLLEEMFGPMKPLDVAEYYRIYRETGVDVDGRQQEFLLRVVPLMEHRIYAHCAFLKALPGFRQLTSQDQIAIMKASKGEDLMLSLYRMVNVNEGLYYDKEHKMVVDIDLIKRFTSPEFARRCFEMCRRLQSYDLSLTEQVLLKGVCFLCSDRVISAEGKEYLERIHEPLVHELQRQLLEKHSDDPALPGKLTAILTELRGLAYKLDIILARVVKEFKHLPIPPSVKEMMTPEGMAYPVPDVPLPGACKSAASSVQRSKSPRPQETKSSPYIAGHLLFSEEPPPKRINWSFVRPPPNPNNVSIQNLGQPPAAHSSYVSGSNGLLSGVNLASATAASSFTVQNLLEKSENRDSSVTSESKTDYPAEYSGEYGHISIAHIFTQPLRFSRELESEPIITPKVEENAPRDATTERVITYENL